MANTDQINELQMLVPVGRSIDCHAILKHAKDSLSRPIFNHSLRVYLLAVRIQEHQIAAGQLFKDPTGNTIPLNTQSEHLFAACMFHDIGTCPDHNGPQRFEVEGADAAVTFLKSQNFTNADALRSIWCAIALHTSAGIAERVDPFTYLVRMAVKADFAPTIRDSLGLTLYSAEIEQVLSRLGIEQCLAEAVVAQATRGEKEAGLYAADGSGKWTDSAKFPKASWPGVLLRGSLEKFESEGVNWQGPNPAF